MSAIRWSRTAQADLASIDDHYAAIAPAFADEVARAAVAAARFLLRFPHAGPRCGLGEARKWRVRGTPYLLFYKVDERDIEIIRVRHAQQDWPTVKLTGLLGGSFNPAHRAHRGISLAAIAALGLDEVWWLVSPGNPLKPASRMAPLAARLASARAMARHAPIRPTAIEQRLGTRYTVDTLTKLVRRYPDRRFIWLMGADNLVQFPQWREWRRIARTVPIAVIARPGYDGRVRATKAMGWLGRFIHPPGRSRQWMNWRPPALVLLRFRPDPTSATRLRAGNPRWHVPFAASTPRDPVTRRTIR